MSGNLAWRDLSDSANPAQLQIREKLVTTQAALDLTLIPRGSTLLIHV